jgi:hypothetical protein
LAWSGNVCAALHRWRCAADEDCVNVDWYAYDLEPLARALRSSTTPAEAEKMLYAFERAIEVARVDPDLLEHLLVAVVCLLARLQDMSPREVLEQFFRRSVSDEAWRVRYAHLLG